MPPFESRRTAVTHVRAKLKQDPAFQQWDRRKRWFCPYCGEVIGHIQFTDDPLVQDQEAPFHIAIHLMEECAARKDGAEPRARLTADDVAPASGERGVESGELEAGSLEAGGWRPEAGVPSLQSPVSGLPPAQLRTPDSELTPPPLPGAPRTPVPAARVRHSRETHLDDAVAFARKRMQEDELFRQRDPRNRWFCPYCGNIIRSILLPDDTLEALQDVPFLIADHLVNECSLYNKDHHPAKRLEIGAVPGRAPTSESQVIAGLQEARKRQRHMLPSRTPRLPGVEFECFYQPCDVISGDFYDFIRISDHELWIAIGDVSGHGIEAAIVMAMAKKLIQVHGRSRSGAAETLIVTNADIADDVGEGVFISVFYGVLDIAAGKMTCARAGHPPALLYNKARMSRPMKIALRGLAMGLDHGRRFQRLLEEWVVKLEPGDLFIGYTDGLSELENPQGDELGFDGLCRLVQRYGDRRPAETVRQIVSAGQKFAGWWSLL